MSIYRSFIYGATTNCGSCQSSCPDPFGCPPGVCPDFEIKRHDTQPPYRLSVSDCNGPLDLTGCIAEVSMWAIGKLKKKITATDTYFALADNIGFFQANVGDVIVMDRIRNPEQMLVTGFDEENHLIQVQRGYNGTTPGTYNRGNAMRIFRILNAVADTKIVTGTVDQVDGPALTDVVIDSQLIYNWLANDTCLPGCYWLEFKLLKMITQTSSLAFAPDVVPLNMGMCNVSSISVTPTVIPSFIPSVSGCDLGIGVEWVRRFPLEGEGFLVKIIDSPTAENVL